MNTNEFKKIIKKAVIEALREELPNIITEVLKSSNNRITEEKQNFNFSSNDVSRADFRQSIINKMGLNIDVPQSPNNLQIINKVNEDGERINPYLNFIMDTAANMTPADRSGLRNLD